MFGGIFVEELQHIISSVNGVLWGPALLIILLGTHVFFTFRLKFIQRHLWLALKLMASKDKDAIGDISPFGALMSSLAATIGTGNIIGVAIAVSLGGPGAIFWCWLTGVFGMSTKYAEALLALKYRVKTSDGTMLGGPMYTIKNGLNMHWLAVLFCIFTAIASFGIGNTVPANSITSVLEKSTGISPYIIGSVMALIVFAVVIGGVKSIAKVCSALVPTMSLFYIFGSMTIIFVNSAFFIDAVTLIVKSAFTPQAAGGGFVASTFMIAARMGIMRGLYSNESGMGSAPILASAARANNPVRQAIISMTGTFWDTVIICPLTGLVLITSMLKNKSIFEGLNGAQIAVAAFDQIPYSIGVIVLNIGIILFAFSTILGWIYYGEKSIEFLFGKRALMPYRLFYCFAVFIGSITTLEIVWGFADSMNALMALPNILSLWLLSKVVVNETNKYMSPEMIDSKSDDPVRYADDVIGKVRE